MNKILIIGKNSIKAVKIEIEQNRNFTASFSVQYKIVFTTECHFWPSVNAPFTMNWGKIVISTHKI